MLPWETLATARTPDGTQLTLARRGTEFAVRAGGRALMSSQTHFSEEALARLAFERVPGAPRVLLGGLGLGFTLRAVLERLPPEGQVVVAELSEALLEWNRTLVADLAGRPLDDPRVEVRVVDVSRELKRANGAYDAILLDVDNGPAALTQAANEALYGEGGVYACLGALASGGVLTVWSAGPDADLPRPAPARRLRRPGPHRHRAARRRRAARRLRGGQGGEAGAAGARRAAAPSLKRRCSPRRRGLSGGGRAG